MKSYRIFKHPAGHIEAVKQGWSWPGLFFTFIWAFIKRLWAVGGVVLAVAFVVGAMLDSLVSPETANVISNVLGVENPIAKLSETPGFSDAVCHAGTAMAELMRLRRF